jgi:hypothetical protein
MVSPGRRQLLRAPLFVVVLLASVGSGSQGMEVMWEDNSPPGEGHAGKRPPRPVDSDQENVRPVTGVCGPVWRRARPEQLARIHDRTWMLLDKVQADPTDVSLYQTFETACKDEGDHNTRLRVIATMMRLDSDEYEGLRELMKLHQGYALGDRAFWHAKACRFAERDRDFALWAQMWTSGAWDQMLTAGHSLPVLPFYALVFPFNMTQVWRVSKAWAAKFGSYIYREALPSPFSNSYLLDFTGNAPSRRLKIGYISSDIYRVHPVGKSINACLRLHDQNKFEVRNLNPKP